jgi:hypothetical protein
MGDVAAVSRQRAIDSEKANIHCRRKTDAAAAQKPRKR